LPEKVVGDADEPDADADGTTPVDDPVQVRWLEPFESRRQRGGLN
jgi:hypothetical protein